MEASSPKTSPSQPGLPLPPHAQHDRMSSMLFNGSVSLQSQMLARSAQKSSASARLPTYHDNDGGQPKMNKLNLDILSRMVTASGTGASTLPIRVASMQDFRRSSNSLNTVPESSRQTTHLRQPNQTFALNRHSALLSSNRPMSSENPLLKMMEERMAARNSAMAAGAAAKNKPPLPPIAASPSPPPLPEMSADNKAALQASISKWAGAGDSTSTEKNDQTKSQDQVTMQSVTDPPQTAASPQSSGHGSPSSRVPLTPKQIELLHELTASQSASHQIPPSQAPISQSNQSNEKHEIKSQRELLQQLILQQAAGLGGQRLNSNPQQASIGACYNPVSNRQHRRAAPLATAYAAHAGLTRCAVSSAELERLRKENISIQLMRDRAIQERMMQEQTYMRQRNLAASALVSLQNKEGGQATTQEMLNQMQVNALKQIQKLSTTELNSLSGSIKSNKSSSSFRKRRSMRHDEDDSVCSQGCSSTQSASVASYTSSNKIHRSLSHSSARAGLSGSMDNLRIESRMSMLSGGSNKNASFSSGLNVRNQSNLTNSPGMNMQNQSFSSSSRSHLPGTTPSCEGTLKRSPPSNNWIRSLLTEQKSAGDAAATFQVVKNSSHSLVSLAQNTQPSPSPVLKHSSHGLVSLAQDIQLATLPKDKEAEVFANKPIQVKAEEYAPPIIERPPSTSNETVIISAVPDRIKYQNAVADIKPIEIVKKALSSRGAKCTTKPSMDVENDFFTKVTEMYDQEIVNAIRSNDLESLKLLHAKGTNLQCGNRFGETLIHLACRRSHRDLVSFLVNEAGVSLRVRDDFGRTPWHDACWRTEPDLDLLDLLLDEAPELLMLSDKRGHTPLDYARREHWAVLVPFLLERAEKFRSI